MGSSRYALLAALAFATAAGGCWAIAGLEDRVPREVDDGGQREGGPGGDAGTDGARDGGPDGAVDGAEPLHFEQSTALARGPFVASDAAGNVLLGFTFNRSTTVRGMPIAVKGGDDIAVVKLNPSGVVVWASVFGGAGNETLNGLAVDAAGNTYLVGSFTTAFFGLGPKALTHQGGNGPDPFVAKLDPNGAAVAAFDYAIGVAGGSCDAVEVRATNVLVACRMMGAARVPTPMAGGSVDVLPVGGGSNVLVAMLRDTDLASAWVNELGGSLNDAVSGVAFTPNGAAAFVAMHYGSGPVTDTKATIDAGASGAGSLIARLNVGVGGSGFQVLLPEPAVDERIDIRAITATNDEFIIAGELRGTSTLTNGAGQAVVSAGASDIILAGFTTGAGTSSWVRQLGTVKDEGASAVGVDSAGRIYAGVFYSATDLAIDGLTLPAPQSPTATKPNVATALVEIARQPSAGPAWARVVMPSPGPAGLPSISYATWIGFAPPKTVLHAGHFRGSVDLGDGRPIASFDPAGDAWDAFLLTFQR
jgi:hypothetical protein